MNLILNAVLLGISGFLPLVVSNDPSNFNKTYERVIIKHD